MDKFNKHLPLLSMLYITAYLGTFVLAYKMCYIYGILQSAAIFIFPWTFFIGNIVAEVYGYEAAKRLVWHGLICAAIFAIAITFLIKLPPPPTWNHQAEYQLVLKPILWFFISSFTGVTIGSWLNVYIISKWKTLVKGKHFIIRSIGSSCIGELITSLIVEAMAFSQQLPLLPLIRFMITIYCIKMIYAIILSYPGKLLSLKLKLIENVGVK